MGFVNFMRSNAGRLLRIVAGLALILVGLFVIGGTRGVIVAIVGLVPLAAGIFNFCLFGPLFGVDLWGRSAEDK
ncbi:MAG: hypothetical protein QG596_1812 [Actinomycetota bacterium]|jgi:hydrogenase-4 membrane subunit HyfE|nr:hypothetical protein [Actinomycetota bacterium]